MNRADPPKEALALEPNCPAGCLVWNNSSAAALQAEQRAPAAEIGMPAATDTSFEIDTPEPDTWEPGSSPADIQSDFPAESELVETDRSPPCFGGTGAAVVAGRTACHAACLPRIP